MSTKQKNAKKLSVMESIKKEQRQERQMIADINAKERLMKWLLIAVIILLLLLILFAGYATDWLRGVNKDETVTPVNSSLDSVKDAANGSAATGTASEASTTGVATNTGTTDTTNASNNSRASESSSTSRDSTTTTTTNNTTTNNPSPTPAPTPNPQPNPGLLSLYADSSVGGNIESILENAQLLGLSKSCRTSVLIQICEITDGTLTVTTKNLLGTGIVTSLTKDF
jgi:cytoskeletal protein RodZ